MTSNDCFLLSFQLSPTLVILIVLTTLLHHLPHGCLAQRRSDDPFLVTATPSSLTTSPSNNISLVCASSAKPILCLWKTPYGHVYTLSEGVFAESGRLRHLSGSAEQRRCGLEIIGVQPRDQGNWECEVGAVIQEDFRTKTDEIQLEVKSKTMCMN